MSVNQTKIDSYFWSSLYTMVAVVFALYC